MALNICRRYATWPPKLVKVETLGYFVDRNGRSYPRDIGRSTSFGPLAVIVQFGDTLFRTDEDEAIGTTSSTAGIVFSPCPNPTVSTYVNLNSAEQPLPFIPTRPGEEDTPAKRHTLRCYGGVVQIGKIEAGVAAGWVFYQKGVHYAESGRNYVEYTGAAKVYYDVEHGRLSARRPERDLVLFKSNEPSFGTFTAISHEGMAYLFGIDPKTSNVMLARVNVECVLDKRNYTYWDGRQYQGDLKKAKPVIENMLHGAIWKSDLFHGVSKSWVFVGCTPHGDNAVVIGAAARIEGPYEFHNLMQSYCLHEDAVELNRYCVYPHPWAFRETDGELMISWSEGGVQGGVVGIKIELAQTMELRVSRNATTDNEKAGVKRREKRCVVS